MNGTIQRILFSLAIINFGAAADASVDSIGPNGINSFGLGLTGNGVSIGQVERRRPGDPKDNSLPGPPNFDTTGSLFNSKIDPERVFITTVSLLGTPSYTATANDVSETNDPMGDLLGHATAVAGVMISTDAPATGVAPQADLFSTGFVKGLIQNEQNIISVAAQHIATQNGGTVRAINMSFGLDPLSGEIADGQSRLSSFVDWSARVHDVLYVTVGPYSPEIPDIRIPADNFNGITVAYSKKNADGVYREVDPSNIVIPSLGSFFSDRTYIDLLAPGDNILVAAQGNNLGITGGTSIAAPHVTGTIALLQEHANTQINNSILGWNPNAQRHEVMKSVLMNSADKIAGRLGSTRTVLKKNGSDWDSSFAADDELLPLDEEMGAGHLNAARALQQFSPGESNPDGASVPVIGWDYDSTSGLNDINKYVLNQELAMGTYISMTLAWDREVTFNSGGAGGIFHSGDTFNTYTEGDADDVINDLDLYLMPKGAASLDDAIFDGGSYQDFMPLEHVFVEIPTTGEYEIWVVQNDADIAGGQNYGIAWWAVGSGPVIAGDYDGNGIIELADYTSWSNSYGQSVTPGTGSDGNNNGIIDAADYTVWRDAFSSVSVSVPEPSTLLLLVAIVGVLGTRRTTR